MKKTFLTGLSSLLLPLGLYGVPTQAAVGYQRSYLGAGMSTVSTHGSIDVLAHARELIMREAMASDELDIVSAVPVNELVVIDAAVPDKHVLYRGIKPGVEVVELDANTAGLAQLTAILARYKNLSAVHLVSHADEGVLLLGNSRITAENIQQEMETLSALTGAVRDGGDLLFYGCNLAADQSGEALLDIIRDNTGLDVAASDDRTGNAALAGDWDLEIERGKIETDLAFTQKALRDFSGVLAATEYTALQIYNAAGSNYYLQSSLSTADDKIIFSSYGGGVVSVWNNGSTLGYVTTYASGTYAQTAMQIAADGTLAETFELHELKICASDANDPTGDITVNLTVTGYNASDANVGSSNFAVTTKSCRNGTSGEWNDFDAIDLSGVFGANFDLKRVVISYNTPPAANEFFLLKSVTLDNIQAPDAVAPTVSSVGVPSNGTYITGQNLDFTVNTDENVIVNTGGGTPQIALTVGATARQATYLSGSGTSALVFRYTVQAGDTDTDGIAVAASVNTNGGILRDGAGNNLNTTLNSVGSTAAVLVDAVAPTVSSASVPSNGTYSTGQNLDFTVNTTESVTVNTGGGTPEIALAVGATTRQATYRSGSGTSALVFRYTAQAGDSDTDGIAVGASVNANGGTLRDGAGNNLTTTLNSVGSTTSVLIDAVAPTISSINRVNAAFSNATSVDYTVTFAENVSGVDAADFTLTATGTANGTIATVTSVSGSIYTVTANSITGDGTLRLDLNGSGTGIADLFGNAISSGYTSGQVYSFDNTAPAVSSVSVPANATYVAGQNLDFTLNANDAVILDTAGGTPYIAVTVGATTRQATYRSGSGTSALIFRYTVQTDDNDTDGIALGAAAVLDGGTMRDAAGNNLISTLNNVGATSGILVDAVAPTLQSLNPADGFTTVATNANFVMTFSEDIALGAGNIVIYNALNSPVATINVADHAGQLSVVSNQLTINPVADLNDGSSYYVQLSGGAVKDVAGIAYEGIADSTTWNFTVADITPPTATIAVADAELLKGETTSVTITFSEAVTGFTNSDLTVPNGSLSTVSSTDGGITWTATFTPDQDIYELDNLITLDNTGIADGAGNTGSGTTSSNEFMIRTQALTLLVTSNLDTGDDETMAATLADDEADGSGLSLREALFWARSNGDTITFDLDGGAAGNQGGTITLNGNQLVVAYANLIIDGDLDDDGIADITLSGNNASRVMLINNSLNAIQLTGLTLTEGLSNGGGGAMQIGLGSNVTVRNSNITDSTDGGVGGGGIYGANATLTLLNSTVSGNSSSTFGGGLRIVGTDGTLNLIDSTVHGNTTTGIEANGAGIQYGGSGALTVVNSTISGNAATGASSSGGGLRITSGIAFLYNTTIVGNAATGSGGGVSANGTNDTFANSVIAGNTSGAGATAGAAGSPLATGGAPDDVGGTIEVATNSFFGTTVTITTDTKSLNNQGTADLLLSDLADNGGYVLTHRPQAGSTLSDAGSTAALPADVYDIDRDSDIAEALPLDAIGAERISGASVDIGAVEGNRAPELFDLNGGNTYIEDGVAVVIDNGITVTDDEMDELNGGSGNYSGASITIARNGGADASDNFDFVGGSGISLVADELIKNSQVIASFDTTSAGQLIVTFTDANGEIPSRIDVNAVMQQLTYATSSNDPATSIMLDWTFTDEASASITESASITVSLKNNAPLVTATGGTPTFTENGTAADLFSAVSISPVEAAQSIISLQLTVTGANNGSDEILAIDGSDVALTQGNSLVTATNALNVSVSLDGTTATVTLSHATGITGAAAQAVVDGMTYRNTSENPNPLGRVVTLNSVQDNGGVANDGADTTSVSIATTVTISAVNNAPIISGTPAIVTDQNAPYSFTPSAADSDSDTLTFSITNQPTWANFDNETGTLSGVPSQANVGVTSNIVITVSDGDESTNLPAFSLTVVNVNDAPGISGVPTISVDQDAPYSFVPSASDLDGDTLTFSIINQPAWANFNTNTGALTGTPTVANIGDYAGIVISVSDGALSASLPAFTLRVLATNVAPEISGTPPLTAYVGTVYSFTPTASDADDDELTFSALGLPTWLTLNTATGQLHGTPGADDADMSYNIALSVSDGIETTTLPVFSLSVEYDGAEPVVTPPEDITINATGLYSPISLRQLLSLPPGTSPTAVQEALGDLASDSTGGEDCCVTEPQGLLGNLILLPPGRHEIIWRATNPDNLTGEAVQVVNVRPLVAFGKYQITVEDTSVQVRVILNGRSPFYPLEVPYVIDPTSSALLGIDHDAMDGSVIFTEGQTEVSFTVNLLAGGTAGDTRLIFRLGDSSPRSHEPIPNFDLANPDIRDINAGAADHHFVNIVDGNVKPKVSLVMNQAGADSILVGAGSGLVTVTAVVTDPNPGDIHSFNWTGTDSRLSDTDGSATNSTFVFDPAGQVGLRKLEVVTTDSAGGVDISHSHFLILPSLPTLDAGTDTDEDGINDLTEGTSDTNGNGIPDYLDNMPSSNVLPQVIISTTSYLIECDPGVICGIGQFALGGESGGVQILNDELGATEGLIADEDFEPVGGIFDFIIRDLPTAGQSVRIAIPQQAPIPANAVYRKLIGGQWANFIENADNTLHSAPGNPGYCPPPGDESWEPGLMEGYLCVQLSIQDGGPNDADGVVNSAIADPGAVSVAKAVKPPSPPVEPTPPVISIDSKGKGGGAMDWSWILLGCIVLLAKVAHLPKARLLILLTALLASATQAQEARDSKYSLRLNLYQAEGSESSADFAGEMDADGVPISLRNYDVTRFAYRIALGMQLSGMATLELGYLDLGDVTVNFDTTTDDSAALSDVLESHYPMSADGVTLSYRFGYDVKDQWRISAEGGLFLWQSKIDLSGAHIDPDLGSGVSPIIGLQLDYSLTRSLGLGMGVNRAFLEGQKVDLWGLSGVWHF